MRRQMELEKVEMLEEKAEMTLSFYCDQWLESRRPFLKAATYVKYESILNNHIKKCLGSCEIDRIDGGCIQAFVGQLLGENLAPKTVRDVLAVLKLILRYISSQTAFRVPEIIRPRVPKRETRILSRPEQARLIRYLREDMDSCKFGVLLSLLTGLRIGEICALRWEDISLESATLQVEGTMQRLRIQPESEGKGQEDSKSGKTEVVIGSPKSDTSLRIIPLSSYALFLCREMEQAPENYVLTGRQDYMEPRTLQYRLKKYTGDCGLEGVHFHTLRHTFATRCVEVGFEIKSLSEILGHASVSVTLNRYVHASLELKRENMEKLGGIFRE